MSDKKYVYFFGEGKAAMKELLGGKGANLAEMSNLGLPVPPGFTITTEACKEYYQNEAHFPKGMEEEVWANLKKLEEKLGKKFGDRENPLLVSVRSGAPVSMPGMMDTILNLGLNDETVQGLVTNTQNPRFAMDCYRRFIQMFGDVVMKVEHHYFEQILESHKNRLGVKQDTELDADTLAKVVEDYKNLVKKETHRDFPQDPKEQLLMAIHAVFASWNNPRAIVYRKINKIPEHYGTAVNVQAMVFGNMGNDSGTGIAFTRNPSTGEKELYGEFLMNAQGEDVVAGIRTPKPISQLKTEMPEVYKEFARIAETLEKHYRDMQDIEFTIEKGKLFMLQTRSGKRTANAAIRVAVDMAHEGLITKEEALLRVSPDQLNQILHRRIDPKAKLTVMAKGLPASPGAASGKAVFDADRAEELGKSGEKVILVRPETSPDDIHGLVAAQGVLTSRGGMTSHAAVVARGMGKPAICGAESVKIDLASRSFTVGGFTIKEGDVISIDGTTGMVIAGEVPMIDPELSPEFTTLLEWADQAARIKVRANADYPHDARKARELGAVGIGLCRTEHMFMETDRLPVVQEMIMATTPEERRAALDRLLPVQEEDFYGIFKAMRGYPVTIRLLDPPLHEFLPDLEELLVEVTTLRQIGTNPEELKRKEEMLRKVRALHENNPMLGTRGCRLGIIYPEIYAMQVQAIFRAACRLAKEGESPFPEVEIPLVGHENELSIMRELVIREAEAIMEAQGIRVDYTVGTMIEIPRACVTAEQIAAHADFFSFGTNDLTQTTFGFSRDDAEGKFLTHYLEHKVLPENPFAVLDRQGVGSLMKMAVEKGRGVKSKLTIGICGEHGGEPSSVEFCHDIGLDYVSCSPFRVPIARLAAAQANLKK